MKQLFNLALSFVLSLLASQIFAGNPGFALSGPLKTSGIKMLSTFLITATGNMADGNRVVFDQQFSNAVDGNDAMKLINPGENFGLSRNGNILAVEARQPITPGDTLYYSMTNLVAQVYRLEIDPQFLAVTGIRCELVDRYLNTRQNISLTDSNHFNFEITSNPSSKMVNRFIVVFVSTAPVIPAFKFASISAQNNENKSTSIIWQVNQELNLASYEIERSADNIHFMRLEVMRPMYNDHSGGEYQYNDRTALNNDNFYRIKAMNKSGAAVYSNVVIATIPIITTSMEFYPNPVVNRVFQMKLNQVQPGRYLLKLINNSGQQVSTTPININGNFSVQTISLDASVGKGNYTVCVWSDEKIVVIGKLIVQ